MEKLICKNCNEEFAGNYCNNCGQKWIEKLSWVFIIQNLGDTLEFKKGILHNLKSFTIYPQRSITEYLNGRTKPFLNPVSYTFIGLALFFITIQVTSMFGEQNPDTELFNQAEKIVYTGTILYPFIFSLILNFSIIEKKPNYLFGLIVSLFLAGHVLILMSLTRGFLFLLSQLVPLDTSLGFFLVLSIFIWFSLQFSKVHLKIGYLQLLLRMFGSIITILIMSFILYGFLISTGIVPIPKYDQGYEFGRLMYSIYQLFFGY